MPWGSVGGSWGRPTVSFALICIGGERRKDLEQRYFRDYWSGDERITRLARLRHGELKHNSDLYTDREKQVSPAYNEMLRDTESQNGLHVRLDGPQGSNIVWSLADSTEPEGWSSAQIETISSLLPHIRQFVRMRQALADAAALGTSLADLLDNTRLGVIHLDRRGRIVAANDRAGGLLQQGDGLADRAGYLRACTFAENVGLQRLLARGAATTRYRGFGRLDDAPTHFESDAAGRARQSRDRARGGFPCGAGRHARAGRRP